MKLSITLVAFAITCFAADVTGTWDVSAPTKNGGEMKLTLTIQSGPDAYTGVISNDEGEAVLRDVRVRNAEITFRIETDSASYDVAATVDGDAMKGSYKVNNNPGGTFTAKRTR